MYRELAEIPTPTAVQISLTVKDHDKKETRTFTKLVSLSPNDRTVGNKTETTVQFVGPAQEQPKDLIASAFSPSKTLRAVLLDKKADATRWVEVWKGDYLQFSKEVTKYHAAFYDDFHYNSLSFAPSENALVYTAEAIAPKNTHEDPFASFRFAPSLGEGFIGRKRPTLFYLHWESPSSSRFEFEDASTATHDDTNLPLPLPPPPHPVHLGQATFITDKHIVATGYEESPDGKLLGLKHCTNRPAGIWDVYLPPSGPATTTSSDTSATTDTSANTAAEGEVASLSCAAAKRTASHVSCRSPVFQKEGNGDGAMLFWLSNKIGGPHGSCVTLVSSPASPRNPDPASDLQKEVQEDNLTKAHALVDAVYDPKSPDAFPGLYPEFRLPPSLFLKLGKKRYLVFHSSWRSRTVVVLVAAEDGRVTKLDAGDEEKLFSWKVLGTDDHNRVLCVRSSPSVPSEFVLGKVDEEEGVVWTVLWRPELTSEVASALEGLRTEIVLVPGRYPVETIVIRSNSGDGGVSPCITIPHGGPHGATSTAFTPSVTARVLNGYTVSMPNFTGSTGYGQKYIEKLLGQCGTLDVEDCKASVDYLVSLGISKHGKGWQFIQGGSHGGFLTAHLVAQHSTLFTAGVMRNPVISIGEVSTSDIPDWYYEECDIRYTPTSTVTPSTYKKMYDASPIAHFDKVEVPLLFLLGEVDQRVAPTQGMAFYHALKGRGKEVDVLMFKGESHGLEGVECAWVGFRAEMEWFGRKRADKSVAVLV
ncbi:Alpha/Beta hydrolase protein [Pterulicium gracile]|uniref:acylaminoacyl-peptidase n=1 Tax=Pterulicium gracile TaxID=1884261 RepID=A0A5C3QCU0_9AGAR|nr:Alpha/Beta hydrolase protein [Pterula gracilis]